MKRLSRPCIALLAPLLLAGCDAVHFAARPGNPETVVEAAVFEGGYGIQWHCRMAQAYSDARRGDHVRVNLWGDPRVQEKVKPRLLRGDPPDLLLMHHMPMWELISSNKLRPFDEILDQPAYGATQRWRDLFLPGMLDAFSSGGKVYAVPSALTAWVCWYDARQFREHGWAPPQTWAAFETLCDAMLAAGIPPLAFQGKYPTYPWYTFIALVQRCGGLAAINRINAGEAGAFTHPDVARAAALMQRMAQQYFQKGAMSMTHTESQLQFVNNRAAMIFCGLWLVNEMRDATPDGFEMRCFNVPAVEGGKGNPNLISGMGGEFVYVPADARHPKEAFDLARFMISPENAPDMARSIGVISPLRGAVPREALSPPLESALDQIEHAQGFFSDRLYDLLLECRNQVMQPHISALLRGEETPEAFCAALDAGVQAAFHNPDNLIPEYLPYAPAAFGEAS
jgi:ABC-type glycerol-3-phosphate transport system substrate-binding protein